MSYLRWDDNDNFEPGFWVGSEGQAGQHLRNPDAGYPYSIYRRARAIGISDVVICHGIMDRNDADQIRERLDCLS